MNIRSAMCWGCLSLFLHFGLAAPAAEPQPPLAALQLPPPAMWTAGPYDEPLGPYYSCGLTLGHLGHNRAQIRQFHEYLAVQKADLAKLAPAKPQPPPAKLTRLLLDPELLPDDKLPGWSWKKEPTCLTGASADDGPSVRVPLSVPRAGLYLMGVRYWGSTKLTGVTGLKVYRRGQDAAGPLLTDEFNNQPTAADGWAWHELLVDLAAGDYDLVFTHITRQWHAPKNIGYGPRKIDCIYLTGALWQELPDAAGLEALRKDGTATGIQTVQEVTLTADDTAQWTKWRLRPSDWDHARNQLWLFAYSYAFWRDQLATLAADPQSKGADYRDPRRQVVFDDVWNLLGNPARISEQIRALGGDVRADVRPGKHYLKGAGQVDERTGGKECDWWPQADKVASGTYYNFKGEVVYTQEVEPGHKYAFWVQFRDIGFFEPWQIWAGWAGKPDGEIHWKRDQRNYPADIQPQRAWVKIGDIDVPADATNRTIRWHVADLPWRGLYAVSYRWIYNFLLTSDPEFQPKGTVLPPTSTVDYLDKVKRLGGRKEDGYLCQATGASPLPPDWWPSAAGPVTQAVRLPPNAWRSFQLGLRGAAEEPVAVGVECGPLAGKGGAYSGKLSWRVPAYIPYGATRSTWAGWCLLRRPYVTVPPYNVAAIHFTVDTHGMKPGTYTGRVKLTAFGRGSGKSYPAREIQVTVTVSPVGIAPAKPVLVHGYTMPPEGEAYLQDYRDHGLKVWCGPLLSKQEMQKRGMLLQQVRARASNGDYGPLLKSIKDAGLSPEDYYAIIWDEPSGKTEQELGKFITAAKSLRQLDSGVRRVFNPGEPAVLATFQVLEPYCDIWMPYDRHFIYHPKEAAAKTAIITAKPWMDYTTPCYFDKEPQAAGVLAQQIRRTAGAPGQCLGTWFFALYYPFRDPWDTENEFLRDASVFVLPSAHGPVATYAWEAVREAIQTTDLALLVKEKAKPGDEAALGLVKGGGMDALLDWLEKNR